MLKNIIELADNKLLILYIIKKLKSPCSNTHITDIILNNNFLNYFLLQQYLNELVENDYLTIITIKNEELYKITPKGKKILEMFQNRISQFKIDCFNNYLSSLEKKDQIITSKISLTHNNLDINFYKNSKNIMKLTIPTPPEAEIKLINKNCEENPKQIYNMILSSISNQKNDT